MEEDEEDSMDEMEDPGSFGGVTRDRICTDKGYLFGMIIVFLILFGLLGYCISEGDIDRIINGFDDCGNVCGKNNIKTDSIPYECFGKNMEENMYLLYDVESSNNYKYTIKTCVKNCEDHNANVFYLNRCYTNALNITRHLTIQSTLQEFTVDFQLCWKYIILLSFVAIAFSIFMMILMRYVTTLFVWFVLITMSIILVGSTVYAWLLFKQFNDEKKLNKKNFHKFIKFNISLTIFTVVCVVLIIIMAKRIKLVIQLFKESVKAIADMPLLLFQPVLTSLVLFFILFMSFYASLWVTSSGYFVKNFINFDLNNDEVKYLDFLMSTVAIITSWYNWVLMLWIIQFVVGCQNMVIAGCVAMWFFTRDKGMLGTPIVISTYHVIRYHLGTVALGSIIITIFQLIRIGVSYLRSLSESDNAAFGYIWCIISYIVKCIENLVKYFTRNAYILTAIHGTPFCISGKRAYRILMNNIFKVVAINSVGDYVLLFTKIYITVLTVLVGYLIFRNDDKINSLFFPLAIVGVIAYFIANCFITVFEMTIDTLFICFCEDCEFNDGLSKPYYMSRNLMEFVENSSKAIDKANWDEEEQEAWDNGPKRVLKQKY